VSAVLSAIQNQRSRQKRASDRPTQALFAIIRHERAARAVAALNRAIGDAVQQCSIYRRAHETEFPGKDTAALWTSDGKVMTHLWEAYNETTDGPYNVRTLDADEQRDYLVGTGCPHCLKAWEAVEARRLARKELGQAKQSIRAIGRAALGKDD
jgi:hypothetical protein